MSASDSRGMPESSGDSMSSVRRPIARWFPWRALPPRRPWPPESVSSGPGEIGPYVGVGPGTCCQFARELTTEVSASRRGGT
jgi:hypothetical protein